MEEAVQRLEHDIAILNSKPMKHPDILAWRVKTKDLNVIRNELTKIERLLEQEGRKLQEMAEKREQAQVPTKKASNHRLVRILSVATNATIDERKALIDKIYNISDKAVKALLAHKELVDLLDDNQREQAMEGLLSFDEIMRDMLDALNLTPYEGFGNRISTDELKRLNTAPNARNCAGCGSQLSDPGMGPKFKHCSKCEP
jgi:hypothetical protein